MPVNYVLADSANQRGSHSVRQNFLRIGFRVPPLQVMGSEGTFSGMICIVVNVKALDYIFVFCKNQNLPSCTQFGLCQDQKVEMFKDDACCSSELVAHPNY